MQQKTIKLTILLVFLALLLAACKPKQPAATPTTDLEALRKAAEQTASAFLTGTALAAPSQTPTPTTTSTATPAPATATATVMPTATAGTPTATSVLLQGERAAFVADVTVPDGTTYKTGDVFTKTWRIRNAGTSTWTAGYALVFISGEKMGGPDRVGLISDVPPGANVDISVNLVAPATTGKFTGYWKLINTAGKFIDDAVYVQINVVAGNAPTATSTSGGILQPTSTATSTSLSISNATMSVDTAEFSGTCPKTFTFTGRFTLNAPATVTYRIEAGASDPAFVFTLPSAQTSSFAAGEQTVTYVLTFSSSVTGWARLHITSPVDLTSNQANFTLTCQP